MYVLKIHHHGNESYEVCLSTGAIYQRIHRFCQLNGYTWQEGEVTTSMMENEVVVDGIAFNSVGRAGGFCRAFMAGGPFDSMKWEEKDV